jgi:tetratricopeptide (TPR) repeat protein
MQSSNALYSQALDSLQRLGIRADERTLRDAAALLNLAIKNAGGKFPQAELTLATVLIRLKDRDSALDHVEKVLEQEPLNFEAQSLKAEIVLANMRVWAEDNNIVNVMLIWFHSRPKYRRELTRLREIFQQLCERSISYEDFVAYADRLFHIADHIQNSDDLKLSFYGQPTDIYGVIANAPLDKIVCANDEQRKQIMSTVALANARSQPTHTYRRPQ